MKSLALCENNALHTGYAANMINEAFGEHEVSVRSFSSGEALIQALTDEGFRPDAVVLDIELDGENGISVAARLNELLPDCQIIFLSGYVEYASEVYLVKHVWFVLKEQADRFLVPAIKKALSGSSKLHASKTMLLRVEGKTVSVPVEDILYLDKFGRKGRVFCTSCCYTVSEPPAKLVSPELSNDLVRCHQGYWVNMRHVTALDHGEFVMQNGTRIPISRSYRDEARSRFFDLYRP